MQHGCEIKRCGTPNAYCLSQDSDQRLIVQLFDNHLAQERMEDDFVYDFIKLNVTHDERDTTTENMAETDSYVFDRCYIKDPIFGDNGTEKQVRAIKTKSGKYKQFCECPGDLHASGYACECVAKSMGHSGMFHILEKVLHRKNNPDTFASAKFQEGNLASNAEACRDITFGYGLGLFQEFKTSSYFPGFSQTDKMLSQFKAFIRSLEKNPKCQYYLQAVTLFGASRMAMVWGEKLFG